jgi:hypothetical protein
VLTAAAAVFLWRAVRAWRENRLVEDTAASRIRSAAQGYVELTGHGLALPKAQGTAPLTGLPCTWWRYKIEERSSNGRSRSWTTIDSGTSESAFLLDDGTGQCIIDPRGAEVFPQSSSVWYGPTEWPQVRIPDGQGFLGKLADALIPSDRYRYTEYRLHEHETVCALGAYRTLGGVSVENPERAVAELLREWKQDQKSLLARFDTNHDGVLESDEWDRARAASRRRRVTACCRSPGMAAPFCCRPWTAERWRSACGAMPPSDWPPAPQAPRCWSGFSSASDRILE